MLFISLTILILLAFLLGKAFEKFGLPGLIGMLIAGIAIGQFSKNWFQETVSESLFAKTEWLFVSQELFQVSPELRTLALIIILYRAGLGISRANLRKIGMPALRMSFIPGLFEAIVIIISAHFFLSLSFKEAGLLAFVIAAVSPAVIVPAMLKLKEKGIGEKKDVPTLVLASASIDDLLAITLFGAFLALNLDSDNTLNQALIKMPVMIITAVVLGLVLGNIVSVLSKKMKSVIGFYISDYFYNSLA